MALVSQKVRCPTCGTRNPPERDRCRICTRTLNLSGIGTQRAFEEALYNAPVKGQTTGRRRPPLWALVAGLAVVLVAVNWMWVGWGPDWAHRKEATEPGSSWRTFETEGWRAVMPGTPEVSTIDSPVGAMSRAWSGVDSHWDVVMDSDVVAPAARKAALSDLYADVIVAEGTATGDEATIAPDVVHAVLPDATLTNTVVQPAGGATPDHGEVTVTAEFSGHPYESSHGYVTATVIRQGTRLYVLATFVQGRSDPTLQRQLASGFTTSP